MTDVLVDVWIPGRPRPKGSLKRQGKRLVESNDESKPWRELMARAFLDDYTKRLNRREGTREGVWPVYPVGGAPRWTEKPVEVFWQAFFAKPAGCRLLAPSVASGAYATGDVDKLERNILDALQGANKGAPGVLGDDALVLTATGGKHWCDATTPQGLYVCVLSPDDGEVATKARICNVQMQRVLAERGLLGSAGF